MTPAEVSDSRCNLRFQLYSPTSVVIQRPDLFYPQSVIRSFGDYSAAFRNAFTLAVYSL